MKNTLLITASAAALMAGIGLASAQGMSRDAPAATTSEPKAPEGKGGHEKAALPQKTQKMNPAPTAQAPDKAKPAPTAQMQEKDQAEPHGSGARQDDRYGSPDGRTVSEPDRRAERAGSEGFKVLGVRADVERAERKVRETLKGENSERLSGVKFSISIGDAVPESGAFLSIAGSDRGVRAAISRLRLHPGRR